MSDKRLSGDLDPKPHKQSDQLKKSGETWRRELNNPSHKTDNSGGTPTYELGENSKQKQSPKTSNDSTKAGNSGGTPRRELGDTSGTSTFNLEWVQQQLNDLKKRRPEVTATLGQVSEGIEPMVDAGDTKDQTIPKNAEKQKIVQDRQIERKYMLAVDYSRHLPKTIQSQ
jgi:hypothetical protein